VLFQRSSSVVAWKENLTGVAVSDSAAWYMEYDPVNCYYLFRNVQTGRYLSHASGGISTVKYTATPSANEWFQLMPDRTDITIGKGSTSKKTHGYWVTWGSDGDFKSMGAKAMAGTLGFSQVTPVNFNFTNSATAQQWIIISEDELDEYRAAAGITAIREIVSTTDGAEPKTYDLQGRRVSKPTHGVYIVGGRKVLVK
jgi:hypothetical protein